jgi:hypothetical protein
VKKIILAVVPYIFVTTSCGSSSSDPGHSFNSSGGFLSFDTSNDQSGGDEANSSPSSDTSTPSGGSVSSVSTSTGGQASIGGSAASGGTSAAQNRTCPTNTPIMCMDSATRYHCCYADQPYCGQDLCATGPAIGLGVEDARCTQGTQKGVWCSNDGGYCCPDNGPVCTGNKGCSDTMDLTKGVSSLPETGSGGTSSIGGTGDGCSTSGVQAKMKACEALIDVNDAISPSCAGACVNKVEFEACGKTECGQWKANCDAAAAMAKATGSSNKCGSYCPAACK